MLRTGTVKSFDPSLGHGWIAPDDGGPDLFVHISAVVRAGLESLVVGQRLSYEVVVDPRRHRASAENLRPL